MTLQERIEALQDIFAELESTTSMNEKRDIVSYRVVGELQDDFQCCLEVLAGKHKLGYKYRYVTKANLSTTATTVRELIYWLEEPTRESCFTVDNINAHCSATAEYAEFLEPLCNRTYKLGIGPSLLPKGGLSPMLAKKFEGTLYNDMNGFYVTEKLDGNRCIAFYDGAEWNYVSRNGKPMNVSFDMSDLPTDRVYDGEILSPEQVAMSEEIYKMARGLEYVVKNDGLFNMTSGLINSKGTDKALVYNIFDIIDDEMTYAKRREELNKYMLIMKSANVRIVPVLLWLDNAQKADDVFGECLGRVCEMGGEGLMINYGSAGYEHKRTKGLLKFKEVQTMDMRVLDVFNGKGKYEGFIGGITCQATTEDGKIVTVDVGSGLSDLQRFDWLIKQRIVGQIVEIEYFSLSQNAQTYGTNKYSMRFPRLKKVRTDKSSTSEF